MEALNLLETRHQIIHNYARWCAFSSTRSGSSLKSRADIYPLIDTPNYVEVLTGSTPIDKPEFNQWHEKSTLQIQDKNKAICIGWATKLINVYLKTMVYIAAIGRPELNNHIHPPIDGGLWEGIKENYKDYDHILIKTHSITRIKNITSYAQYRVIMEGIELIAKEENSSIFEVEKIWKGTEYQTKLA